MAEPFIGQISTFAFDFAPNNWAFCNGGTAPINQYTALFSLIGTSFGGNGVSNFGLPNLNGATPCGTGQGSGLSNRMQGQAFGSATVTLDATMLPAHTHNGSAAALGRFGGTTTGTPSGATALASPAGVGAYATGGGNATMSPSAISTAPGGGGAHNNLQPFITMNYCIALLGIYPQFD